MPAHVLLSQPGLYRSQSLPAETLNQHARKTTQQMGLSSAIQVDRTLTGAFPRRVHAHFENTSTQTQLQYRKIPGDLGAQPSATACQNRVITGLCRDTCHKPARDNSPQFSSKTGAILDAIQQHVSWTHKFVSLAEISSPISCKPKAQSLSAQAEQAVQLLAVQLFDSCALTRAQRHPAVL